MAEHIVDENSVGSRALLRELKYTLYRLARLAEHQNSSSFAEIQVDSEQSLQLIDSYLLSSASEYGQLKLDLTPIAIGSVMHEASLELRCIAKLSYVQMNVQARANQPVMTNRTALNGFLTSVGQVINDSTNKSAELVMRSFTSKDGSIGVGVFAREFDVTSGDLRNSLDTTDEALMPFARHSAKSGVLLTIADGLARSLGGSLEVKRLGKLRGLATTLPKSDQLSLV